jgi:hypothetical protein
MKLSAEMEKLAKLSAQEFGLTDGTHSYLVYQAGFQAATELFESENKRLKLRLLMYMSAEMAEEKSKSLASKE